MLILLCVWFHHSTLSFCSFLPNLSLLIRQQNENRHLNCAVKKSPCQMIKSIFESSNHSSCEFIHQTKMLGGTKRSKSDMEWLHKSLKSKKKLWSVCVIKGEKTWPVTLFSNWQFYIRLCKSFSVDVESNHRCNLIVALETDFSTGDATTKFNCFLQCGTLTQWMYAGSNECITGTKWIDNFRWWPSQCGKMCIRVIVNSNCTFDAPWTNYLRSVELR